MGVRVRGKATARPEEARGPTLRVGLPSGWGRPTPSLKCRCRAKVRERLRRLMSGGWPWGKTLAGNSIFGSKNEQRAGAQDAIV
jgi:hypothetical protein